MIVDTEIKIIAVDQCWLKNAIICIAILHPFMQQICQLNVYDFHRDKIAIFSNAMARDLKNTTSHLETAAIIFPTFFHDPDFLEFPLVPW